VEESWKEGEFSLQGLAKKLKAKKFDPLQKEKKFLMNINTPSDWEKAAVDSNLIVNGPG